MLDASNRGVLRHQISLIAGAVIAAGLQAQKVIPVIAGVFAAIAATAWSVLEKQDLSGDQPMSEAQNSSSAAALIAAQSASNNAVQVATIAAHPTVQAVVQAVYNNPGVPARSAASVCADILAAVMPELQPVLTITRSSPRTQAEVAVGFSLLSSLLAAFFPHPALQPAGQPTGTGA